MALELLVSEGEMPEAAGPTFSLVKLESGWFWSSYAVQETQGGEGLIGPFPSQEEAEKDARETLGLRTGADA
jgi:hypothetical protein